jgi:hypothetical protein
MHVIPTPQKVTYFFSEGKNFLLTPTKTSVYVYLPSELQNAHLLKEIKSFFDYCRPIVCKISNAVNKYYFIVASNGKIKPSISSLISEFEKLQRQYSQLSVGAESYYIKITQDEMKVCSISERGIFYALQTLLQLGDEIKCKKKVDGKGFLLPCVEIADWPVFEFRAVSDDISRGQVSTVEDFKNIISRLAHYKYNVFMPYIEDMFYFRKHPLIGRNRGRLTKEEVMELVECGKKHYIDVVPIFQTIGHYERILHIPKYKNLAEVPIENTLYFTPIFRGTTLATANPGTFKFLKELFSEIVPAFPAAYFHIGGDEPYDLGKGQSKELLEKLGGEDKLYAYHIKKVLSLLRKYNKKYLIYSDAVLNFWLKYGRKPEITKDLIIVYWEYTTESTYPKLDMLLDAGYKVIISPTIFNFCRFYPDYVSAKENIYNFVKYASERRERGVLGTIISSWCDCGADNFREYNWYGYILGGEYSWNASGCKKEEFDKKFVANFYKPASMEWERRVVKLVEFLNTMDRAFPRHFFIFWGKWADGKDVILTEVERNKIYEVACHMLLKIKRLLPVLPRMRKNIKKNKYYLSYVKFALERMAFFCKYIISKKKNKLLFPLLCDLRKLVRDFKVLWLRTNKVYGLEFNVSRYKQLYDKIKEEFYT